MPELAIRQLFRDIQKRDRESLRQANDILKGLRLALLGRASALLDEVFRLGWADKEAWRRKKGFFLRSVASDVQRAYDDLARLADRVQKDAFFSAYQTTLNTFKGIGKEVKDIRLPELKFQEPRVLDLFKQKVGKGKLEEGFYVALLEASPLKIHIGTGKVSKDFLKFLSDQFDQELFPERAIKTLAPEHITFVQGIMLGGISKGLDLGWQKDRILQYLGKGLNGEKRRELEYKVMRILRTSHQRASNAATTLFAQRNKHIISGLIRRANGRPCLACLVLDGKEYPIGAVLDDHPSGMCVFVYKLKNLEELGLEFETLPDPAKKIWKGIKPPRPLASKFYELPESQQRAIFSNNRLFELWKKEKFPLERLAVNKKGMWTPITYKEALKRLPELGGVSFPRVSFVELRPLDFRDYASKHLASIDRTKIPKDLASWDTAYKGKRLDLEGALKVIQPLTDKGDVEIIGGIARRGFTNHDLDLVFRTNLMGDQAKQILDKYWEILREQGVNLDVYIKAKDGYFAYSTGSLLPSTEKYFYHILEKHRPWALRVPQTTFREITGAERLRLSSIIDPRDRIEKGYAVIRLSPEEARILKSFKTPNGQNLFGMGLDEPKKLSALKGYRLLSSADEFLWGRPFSEASWYDWNTRARYLGIARRKATDGSWYFVVPEGQLDEIYKALARIEVNLSAQIYEAKVMDFMSRLGPVRVRGYRYYTEEAYKKKFPHLEDALAHHGWDCTTHYAGEVSGYLKQLFNIRSREELQKFLSDPWAIRAIKVSLHETFHATGVMASVEEYNGLGLFLEEAITERTALEYLKDFIKILFPEKLTPAIRKAIKIANTSFASYQKYIATLDKILAPIAKTKGRRRALLKKLGTELNAEQRIDYLAELYYRASPFSKTTEEFPRWFNPEEFYKERFRALLVKAARSDFDPRVISRFAQLAKAGTEDEVLQVFQGL